MTKEKPKKVKELNQEEMDKMIADLEQSNQPNDSTRADEMLKVISSGGYTAMLDIIYEDNKHLFESVKCYRCKAKCCRDTVALPVDLLEKHKDIETETETSRCQMLNLIDIKQEIPAPKGYIFVQTPDRKCVFLDRKTNKCRVYEERSIICKCYPFNMQLSFECNAVKPNFDSKIKVDSEKIMKVTQELIADADKNGYYIGDQLVMAEEPEVKE